MQGLDGMQAVLLVAVPSLVVQRLAGGSRWSPPAVEFPLVLTVVPPVSDKMARFVSQIEIETQLPCNSVCGALHMPSWWLNEHQGLLQSV